ncbi:hypothetical protein K788_00034685 [Paraburkholderia caribensis MBA4]|uniref:Uncharacterized protein n=1 Tax=Paraburkholderia caribensis MBA4 TaxID=1323664 RepID=A0A0P0R6V8_9BURK|nr:hypothetical protein K788_00034685 [Paraburkholderia caribensis MBA4]
MRLAAMPLRCETLPASFLLSPLGALPVGAMFRRC